MHYELHRIPKELQDSPQWIVWRSESRDGKPTKVPYQTNGELAKSNDPSTWSSFNAAVQTFPNGYDGIGFMFSENDPFIGVDIDKCMEDGELSDTAREIVDLMESYTELSPSGKGLHIIVRGELPNDVAGTGKKNPQLGIEVYRHGRYFTFTGKCLWHHTIEERTNEIQQLFDRYLVKVESPISKKRHSESQPSNRSNSELWTRMFSSKNGDAIQAMFHGELINGDHSATDMALCNHLAFWTNKDPEQMDSMFRESGLYREKWEKRHSSDGRTYGQMTIDNAIDSTQTTVGDHVAVQPYEIFIGTEESSYEESNSYQGKNRPFFRLSELGNAERLVYHHGERLRYSNELGWLIWNGKYWRQDEKLEIESIAAKTLRALYQECREISDEALAKQIYAWAKRCEKRSVRMNSILDTRPMVAVSKHELDSHNYLFNCENGVIDLKTGKLQPHSKDLLLTKLSNVTYEETAECPSWKAFIESIFVNDKGEVNHEIIDFLQKAVGYTLTGDISEQVMFFLYGTGRNGKSTFINTIQTLLGDYGRQTNSDTFIKKRNDNGINNDIARLDGARFVSAVESEEGQQLSESLVKQITGGEKMTARFMRQEFFEFTPEFKVFFTTNHKPIIKGSDEGIWRRIRLIPFEVTIAKEKVDKKLPEKLAKEMPGILRWAVEGCIRWQKEGLGEPEAIRVATEGYRNDMDILGPFIDEKCLIHPLARVEAKALYEEYKDWCFKNGEIELKNRAFYRALESRGYKKGNGAKNKVYFLELGLKRENWDLVGDGVNERVNENQFINPEKVVPINRQKL
ncbi:phage/plasmid primase, P4 family [Brevibacillus sp. DP1.3A]|uniref:phage/plasmid primase, P4 family n=1 Tax=Brevibacillus sp. DP1.3A TaxID=2738867 RepID=UPI00156BBBCC|nr:phage/plasmid primase, P4 family [Brevibacillus sp. DP1.3A]UED76080.1 phage/plasmid primase, P4 family [Brevibacillus sp. DP1.3A]